ncbi:xanthine dehydrogenase family protein subunit M [Pelagibacteraceae bacterium]|jgi:aerobic carbon-monoxide dehydrogenase medium subunit|nr:xanthine dehydrogenase family protein subunit M [Pelagibacteraceae bacterium]
MQNFKFKSATSTKEAAKLYSNRSAFLAGGMTILPAIKLRLAGYSDLINIKKIKSLSGIKVSSKSLRIGSTTTHAEVASSKEVGKSIPSLAVLADGIGDPQVRNRGTIGGSIANNDPAADYPSACLALNATIHTNKRKITADKFFKGMFETDLKKGELIETIEFEVPEKSAYAKFPNPASRYAIVGVYVAQLKKEVRVAVTGAASCVFRSKELEELLSNNFSSSAIDNINISSKGFNTDIHASADYRAHITKVMAKKAVSSC